ncbi:MAG: acyl-CoA desaturase [Myxococcales bacterium]|nr:acyl-CoA desaturase [Myxococcales bacterium]
MTVYTDDEVRPEAGARDLRAFGEAMDALKREVEAEVGEEDLRRVRRLDLFSHGCGAMGRLLLHVSLDPLTFGAGVFALWIHKQLQATEIGHTVLHGAYDRIPGVPDRYRSKRFHWKIPIDEDAWRRGHNGRHHGATNVAGRDPDIHFGTVRLTPETPHRFIHRIQLPFTLLVLFPNFGWMMNMHFTGMLDAFGINGERLDFLPDRSAASRRLALRQALRKYVPYYLTEYLLFPALAGPMFAKVLLGNWLSEKLRDVYSAATIFCGHVGEHVASYPEGTRARSRGEWYAMQIEATNNYEVGPLVSMLCGGLDRQIEHHLFPRLSPQRLRQIAPRVRELCEAHGVRYHSDTWPRVLRDALRFIGKLAARDGVRRATRQVIAEAA